MCKVLQEEIDLEEHPEQIEQAAEDEGFKSACAWVDTGDMPTQRLFIKNGFFPIGSSIRNKCWGIDFKKNLN